MFGFITRRQVLVRSGATLAGAILGGFKHSVSAKPGPVPVYHLTPFYDEDPEADHCGGCRACTACINHADNKIFATAQAAEDGRAHANCDCRVVDGELPYGAYVALFGNPGRLRRQSVDRRWPWVEPILQ